MFTWFISDDYLTTSSIYFLLFPTFTVGKLGLGKGVFRDIFQGDSRLLCSEEGLDPTFLPSRGRTQWGEWSNICCSHTHDLCLWQQSLVMTGVCLWQQSLVMTGVCLWQQSLVMTGVCLWQQSLVVTGKCLYLYINDIFRETAHVFDELSVIYLQLY